MENTPYYDPRVVIFKHKIFIRLATEHQNMKLWKNVLTGLSEKLVLIKFSIWVLPYEGMDFCHYY